MKLFHYTCSCCAEKIGESGRLKPSNYWITAGGDALVWLTDCATPDRFALGLTSLTLPCDRTEIRYIVETNNAEPWQLYARRKRVYESEEERLKFEGGREPEHWFVTTFTVRATRDREYQKVTA